MAELRNGVRFVTIKRLAELTGYTEKAIRHKIDGGIFAEGIHWKWGPDGKQLIDLEAYDTWAGSPGRASTRGRRRSSSISEASATAV